MVWGKLFPGISDSAKLLLLIGLIILCATLSVGIAYLITVLLYGSQLLQDPAIMLNIGFIRIMQILNQIGIFILPPILLAVFTEKYPSKYLGFYSTDGIHIIATLLLIIAISPIVSQLMEWNEGMSLPARFKSIEDWMKSSEVQANNMVQWMLSYTDPLSMIINGIMIVLLPAIGEELLFRSVLIRLFKGILKNIHLSVIISAIIFSAFHFQFYGFLPRMFLGLAFGYLFVWTGSIWAPMLAHFINNGVVVVVTYLNKQEVISKSPEEFGNVDSPILLVGSCIITCIIGYYLYKTRKSFRLFGKLEDYSPLDKNESSPAAS